MGKEASADSIGPLLASDFLTKLRGEGGDRAERQGADRPQLRATSADPGGRCEGRQSRRDDRAGGATDRGGRRTTCVWRRGAWRKLEQDLAVSEGELRKRADPTSACASSTRPDDRAAALRRGVRAPRQARSLCPDRDAQRQRPVLRRGADRPVVPENLRSRRRRVRRPRLPGNCLPSSASKRSTRACVTQTRGPDRARRPALSAIPKLPRPFRACGATTSSATCASIPFRRRRRIPIDLRRLSAHAEIAGGGAGRPRHVEPSGRRQDHDGRRSSRSPPRSRGRAPSSSISTFAPAEWRMAGWVAENHPNLEDFLYGRAASRCRPADTRHSGPRRDRLVAPGDPHPQGARRGQPPVADSPASFGLRFRGRRFAAASRGRRRDGHRAPYRRRGRDRGLGGHERGSAGGSQPPAGGRATSDRSAWC